MRAVTMGLLALALVAAGTPDAAASDKSHDGGFFLRMAIGGGHASTEVEDSLGDLELHGPSGSFDIAIGAVVAKNFAIHGTLGGFALSEPTVEFRGFEEDGDDVNMAMSMVGGGVTYFFGNTNAYVTASAGAAELIIDFDGDDETSDTGFAAEVGLGKEWWVGNKWGLGVAVTGGYHSIPFDDDFGGSFKGTSFHVKFTATMN